MGVPAFFKWLTLRYPNVAISVTEDSNNGIDIQRFLQTNANDTAMPPIDNLYIDMNGIIHPCCHPIDRDSPSSLEEIYNSIFDYIEKVIRIVKPKHLIYMAIDGVAPRAKINQQRSRRFRSALEAIEKKDQEQILSKEWKQKGLNLPQEAQNKFHFDSNTITPGTDFLFNLSQILKYYVKERLNNDPLWKDLSVIFSDANVPGEGEHKILDFIRVQRTQPNYNPNTGHCIYGADADLIMLGLIIHEPHFYIIRESLNDKAYIKCEYCGKQGHSADQCRKMAQNSQVQTFDTIKDNNREEIDAIEFSLIKIPILREYLEIEFKDLKLPFKYDFERLIDDFVFICFLVGNDFLPHLPSLKIRNGAIDALLYLYKILIVSLDGYITEGNGSINLIRCQVLFEKLSLVEDEFFKQENIDKIKDEAYRKQNQRPQRRGVLADFNALGTQTNPDEMVIDLLESTEMMQNRSEQFGLEKMKTQAAEKFKQVLKEKLQENSKKENEGYIDTIRLGEDGWKSRYYNEKFRVENKGEFIKQIKQSYIEGVCWVFHYYFNGCVSWEWFYPFHYAPFASDLVDLSDVTIHFNLAQPFQPFEQLLGVLPPYSADALPQCLRRYMTDPTSEIADFYPSKIKLDINNQPYAWMGVNLIPFVEEKRIKKIVKENMDKCKFKMEELEKNAFTDNILISANRHSIVYVKGSFTNNSIDTFDKELHPPSKMLTLKSIRKDRTKAFTFTTPIRRPHRSVIHPKVVLPVRTILMDNLNYYPKTKFKGKQAIDIVRNKLGYSSLNDLEHNFRSEYFDHRTYNNNRAIEYNPEEISLLRKKRYKDQQNETTNSKFEVKAPVLRSERRKEIMKNKEYRKAIHKNEEENDINHTLDLLIAEISKKIERNKE